MEMQINAKLIKHQRTHRAWSQEHLAEVTGLGLRTVQRIEHSGMASNESVSAIATAFDMTVAELICSTPTDEPEQSKFQKNRVWMALAVALATQVVSPPQLTLALGCSWLWFVLELATVVANKRSLTNVRKS